MMAQQIFAAEFVRCLAADPAHNRRRACVSAAEAVSEFLEVLTQRFVLTGETSAALSLAMNPEVRLQALEMMRREYEDAAHYLNSRRIPLQIDGRHQTMAERIQLLLPTPEILVGLRLLARHWSVDARVEEGTGDHASMHAARSWLMGTQ